MEPRFHNFGNMPHVDESQLSTIVRISPGTMLVVDKHMKIIDCAHTEKLFGYSRESLINQSLNILVPLESHKVHKGHVKKYLEKPIPRSMKSNLAKQFKLKATHKDGHTFPVDISLTGLRYKNEVIVCAYVFDLSDYYTYTQEVQRANNAKKEFLSKMSHEIRTPLGGMLGLVNLLEKTQLDDSQMAIIRDLKSCSSLVNTIIGDILDCSKIENGKIELEKKKFQFHDTLISLARIQEIAAKGKKLQFESFISPEIPKCVIGDPTRIQQILNNLLNNAIKFTHKGHVKLSVTLLNMKTENKTPIANIQFKITDTGIGIKSEDLKELFTPFRQLHQKHQIYGGTGLGLLISKQLVELMGGKITVESKEGVGSTFMFNLPLELPKDQSMSLKQRGQHLQLTQKQKEILSGVKILVAEDNIINRMVLTRLLSDIGFENVDTAVDGKHAVQKWEDAYKKGTPFNLVFMDCVMPEMDGFEATQAIRDKEKELEIQPCTIVAVTANALSEDKQRCLESGMDDYLSKPIRVEQLCKLLSSYTKVEELNDAYT